MPTSPQGLYTLPPGNPVVPGTLIESKWANDTMNDLADALTQRLPRDGSAPMTGTLILNDVPPTLAKQAVDKQYVDKFIAYSSGMPIGTIVPYAGATLPLGYLLCNGQAVSRTTYADLFGTIGVIYGAGDGATTFNLPNLTDRFVRGAGGAGRAFGSFQDWAIGSHNHTINDNGHTHTNTPSPHTHADPGHIHGVYDPGHSHAYQIPTARINIAGGSNGFPFDTLGNANTGTGYAGVGVDLAYTNIQAAYSYTNIALSYSGLTIGVSGGTDNRPANICMWYCIKAVHDSTAVAGGVQTITSTDTAALSVDATDQQNPNLVLHTNIAFGLVKLNAINQIPSELLPTVGTVTGVVSGDATTILVDNTNPAVPQVKTVTNVANGLVKLDANTQIPISLIPTGNQTFLGPFDCSGGQNPTEKYPTAVYDNGDTFLVVAAGTINVYDPITYVLAPTLVNINNSLVWLDTAGHPIGWYNIATQATSVAAISVSINAIPNVTATEVQTALEQIELHAATLQNATQTTITPIAGLTANNVQDALAELEVKASSYFTGLKNKLLNGNFDIWQRGASFTSTDKYGPDRWGHSNSKTGTYTRITNPTLNGAYYALQMSTGGVTNTMQVGQSLDSLESIPLRGKVLTMSFWVRFSSATIAGAGNFTAMVCERTSAADAPFDVSNYAEQSTPLVLTNGALPTAWTKYTITRTISNAANNVGVDFQFATPLTSAEFYQLSQVQLEEGAASTAFELLPIQMQLDNCRRYYEQWDLDNNEPVGTGVATAATTASINIKFATKRKLPVISGSTNLRGLDGASNAASSISTVLNGYGGAILGITMVATVVGRSVVLNAGGNANQWIKINADL